jgi:hypothetical protein
MTRFILVLILILAPVVVIHEWNHHHRPPTLLAIASPSGSSVAIFAHDRIEVLPNRTTPIRSGSARDGHLAGSPLQMRDPQIAKITH